MKIRFWPPWFAGLLIALGLLGMTGSSYWYYGSIDPLFSPHERGRRELFGFARGIRSDEWSVDLPLARVQQTSRPAFALVNRDLGLGHLQRNPFDAPVLDWGLAFRPHIWPLLAGNLWSHGVRWFLRSALLMLGLFGWFRALCDDERDGPSGRATRADFAAIGALAVFFSGWLNWWLSHAQAEIIAFGGLAVYAAWRARDAAGRSGRWAWTAATFYLAGGAFFNFYAPVWAPVLWLACAAILDLHFRKQGNPVRGLLHALPAIAAVGAAVVLSVAYYAPFLALIADTIYPGRRVATSAGMPLDRLVDMVWPALRTVARLHGHGAYRGKVPGMNECEAACVEAMPFFLLSLLALVDGPAREAVSRTLKRAPWTAVACGVLGAWLLLPLPEIFGEITLLRWTPWNRAWMPFGIACAALATMSLAELGAAAPAHRRPWREVALAAGLFVVAWLLARELVTVVDRELMITTVGTVALGLAGCLLLDSRLGARVLAAAWVLPLVLANGPVNPVMPARALFARGEGHRVVDTALREEPGRVFDYLHTMGSAMAGFGWPVLNALHTVPDLDLFAYLGPDSKGLTPDVYNRYAHVKAVFPPEPSRIEAADAILLSISPCSERLATLGVNHFLAPARARLPDACADRFVVRRAGDAQLWTRRDPVGEIGVSRVAVPASPLDFDFARDRAGGVARLVEGREGVRLEIVAGERRPVAFAIHLGAVDRIRCTRATAATLGAHVVATAVGPDGGACDIEYLGTAGGLRRLLRPRAPRIAIADADHL